MPAAQTRALQRGPHLYKRRVKSGFVWYAYVPGRGIVSLKTSDAAEAEQRFRAVVANRPGVDVRRDQAPEVSLADATDQYLEAPHGWTRHTLRTAKYRLVNIGTWLVSHGVQYPSEITDAVVDRWLVARSGSSRRTINRDLRTLKLMVAWAAGRGLCRANAALDKRAYLREAHRSARHVVPGPDEVRKILRTLEAQHAGAATAVRALYATGLRAEELRRLRADDLREGRLHVSPEAGGMDTAEPTKGYRERAIPLAPESLAVVRDYLAWTQGKARSFGESWLIKRLHLACEKAQVPRCGLHDLRRAFATEAARAGVPVTVIARWLGHADVRTTELYLAQYRSDRDVVAPVPAGLGRVKVVSKSGRKRVQKGAGGAADSP